MGDIKDFDVIIVGTGPAGIFTALELVKNTSYSILMIEKGTDIKKRKCPLNEGKDICTRCKVCSILCGWGGAGAFSDGKLTLTSEVGGNLPEYIGYERTEELIKYVDSIYLKYGAPEKVFGKSSAKWNSLREKALKNDLELVATPIRHLGTDKTSELLSKIKRDLVRAGVKIRFNEPVGNILFKKGRAYGVKTVKNGEFYGKYIVVAPGREGAEWLKKEGKRLKLKTSNNPVDIGVRVELPSDVFKPITDITYEAKFKYYSKQFDDLVRTFCMNPYGEVVSEYNKGIVSVNGHSFRDKKTDKTNFAILVSTNFTEPFKEPITYGKSVTTLANLLGEGVIVQRLGDLQKGQRSTEGRLKKGPIQPSLKGATPGDLSFVLPYRYLCNIVEMLNALEKVAPGTASRHTLLYGVEVKFYSLRRSLNNDLKSEVEGLYFIGDGAGVSRGLVQASVSGVVAANSIMKDGS
jgi:uncharacterized FAD-dependent dehydrogenase